MIAANSVLIELLRLIGMVWTEAEKEKGERGAPKVYSDRTMFKVYIVSLLKQLWQSRSLCRYLKGTA